MNRGRDVLRIVTEEAFNCCVLHSLEKQTKKQNQKKKLGKSVISFLNKYF